MQRILAVAFLVLVAAACGDGDAGDTSLVATTTTAGASTTTVTTPAPTTTSAPSSTTSAPTTTAGIETTTTTVAPGGGVLAMTRLSFQPVPYVLITNVGAAPIDLGDHWLCRRPAYKQLPQLTMQPGDTVVVGLGDTPPPDDLVGLAGSVDLGRALGVITRADGELGLYTAPTFDSPTAIVDYVEWGAADHGRESVAVEAGIWTAGAFVEVPPETLALTSSGLPEAGFEDWAAEIGG